MFADRLGRMPNPRNYLNGNRLQGNVAWMMSEKPSTTPFIILHRNVAPRIDVVNGNTCKLAYGPWLGGGVCEPWPDRLEVVAEAV